MCKPIGYLSLENLATQWSNDQKMEEVCYFNEGTMLLPGVLARIYTFVVWVKLTDTPVYMQSGLHMRIRGGCHAKWDDKKLVEKDQGVTQRVPLPKTSLLTTKGYLWYTYVLWENVPSHDRWRSSGSWQGALLTVLTSGSVPYECFNNRIIEDVGMLGIRQKQESKIT